MSVLPCAWLSMFAKLSTRRHRCRYMLHVCKTTEKLLLISSHVQHAKVTQKSTRCIKYKTYIISDQLNICLLEAAVFAMLRTDALFDHETTHWKLPTWPPLKRLNWIRECLELLGYRIPTHWADGDCHCFCKSFNFVKVFLSVQRKKSLYELVNKKIHVQYMYL